MIIANKHFSGYTYVMAIINLTPDSFYAASRAGADDVLFRVEKAVREGAAVIDLGAQSTRPNYKEVSAEEEISRLERPLKLIKRNFDVPVSVDTYFPQTARAAIALGADMINDVWGLTRAGMAEVVANGGVSVCIMHNAERVLQGDIFPQINNFLSQAAEKAVKAGVDRNKICLDGGVGFAKTAEGCRLLINGYEKLGALGYPLLLGASRKSFFGGKVEDRLEPTLQSTRLAAKKGVLFIRVHDVKENALAIKEEYENRN